MKEHKIRLEGQDLACVRGDRVLFEGLELTLTSGDVVALRGSNGVGKTSLLRILAGLSPAAAGALRLEGVEASRRELATSSVLVPAAPPLKGDLSPDDHLRFWQGLYGTSPLPDVSLSDVPLPDVPCRLLSTGQRQRLSLLMLVVSGCALWLVDEPTAGLDEEGRTLFQRLVHQHTANGGAVCIASHDHQILSTNTVVLGP